MVVEKKNFNTKENVIGCSLKKILAEKGIAQKQLVEDLGISKQAVSNLCAERFSPSLDQALRIAKYLNIPLEEIFHLKDQEI